MPSAKPILAGQTTDETRVKPEPDGQAAGATAAAATFCRSQDLLLGMQQHPIDIPHVLCQSSCKQGCCYVHCKLLRMTAAYNRANSEKQAFEQENEFLRRELLPQHERVLQLHKREIHEVQERAKFLEAMILKLQKTSSEQQKKHAKAIKTATDLARTQSQKIRALEVRVAKQPVAAEASGPQALQAAPALQPRRSSRLKARAILQASEAS
ncbi:hypothetical protein E8E12_001959 [Didymella heteroderae]|uniref:Uncharacterized protein n=1 Tax=Didymella heteroderae TaxID=1769908 RepID=A0A9P4WGC6_9PLEO|nr:hypothetical protein E8E12_001959 [Didymella heteroderae]